MTAEAALNRLCKWRSILAGWHLGTRPERAPGVQAMRDLQDFRLVIRAEVNALLGLMIEKDIITVAEWDAALERAADELELDYQRLFPGYRATDVGMAVNPAVAMDTNKERGFPP